MSDAGFRPGLAPRGQGATPNFRTRLNRLVSTSGFQSWAARFPLIRGFARRDGAEIFDIVQGFVSSQVLMAILELGVLDTLLEGPNSLAELARKTGVPAERLKVLLGASVAMKLVRKRRAHFDLTRRGAAIIGVPGLRDMISHHKILYRDLQDPAAFFRGETAPELATFWPYVFGAGAAKDPVTAGRYSHLMADSQALVAEDTLATVDFTGITHLMDVGGGTGAFLAAVLGRHKHLAATLFDLPSVLSKAHETFARDSLSGRVTLTGGSFRDQALPTGADAISLIRVLYDHSDETVLALLNSAREALPAGGRLIVSEPMLGCASGDVYFATYTLAMGTGKTRSPAEIAYLIAEAGFTDIKQSRPKRAYVTRVVTAVAP